MTRKYLDSVRKMFSRRRAMQSVATLVGAAAVGCSGDDGETTAGSDTAGDGDGDGDGDGSSSEGGTTAGGDGDGDGD
ncbi:MAG: hypothetical protein KC468_36320, partial [Myxococcales bacterium]|nr:hypothetical protein [Myxococcales bacterium]